MKILGLSDLHSSGKVPLKRIKKVIDKEGIDLLIHAGDITTYGSSDTVKNILKEFSQLAIPQFYIPGNMDAADAGDHQLSNITPLHARVKSFQGVSFLGLGGSNPTPFNTPNELEEQELQAILEHTAKDWNKSEPLFLVSHSPPFDSAADKVRLGQHVGSKAVRAFIEQYHPVAILCGHIHESKSVSRINSTLCVNPGAARHKNATIITLKKKEKDEISAEGTLLSF